MENLKKTSMFFIFTVFIFVFNIALCAATAYGNTINGTLEPSDGRSIRYDDHHYTDLYSFTLGSTTQIQISMTSTFNDDRIFLYRGSSPSKDSYVGYVYTGQILNSELNSGTYCIEVTSGGSGKTGSYALTSNVDLTQILYQYLDFLGTLDPGDGRSIRYDDHHYTDLYTFTLSTKTLVQIWMTSTFNDDRIFLYRGSSPSKDSYVGYVYTGQLINSELDPGTYCIEVTSGGSGKTGSYALTSTVGLTEVPYQYFYCSGTLDPSDGLSIRYSDPHYTDLYTFTLSTKTLVQIWMTSTFNDDRIFLYRGSSPSSDSYVGYVYTGQLINSELDPGTYCIEVTSGGSKVTGSYQLTSSLELPCNSPVTSTTSALQSTTTTIQSTTTTTNIVSTTTTAHSSTSTTSIKPNTTTTSLVPTTTTTAKPATTTTIITTYPSCISVTPAAVAAGATVDVTISLENIDLTNVNGFNVAIGCAGVTVNSAMVISTTEIVASVTVSAAAQACTGDVTITGVYYVGIICMGAFNILPSSPITADFIGSPSSGTAPLSVTFTNMSSGDLITHEWKFGDGSTSKVKDPIHVYKNPGTYSVILTTTGANGKTATKLRENYISVKSNCPLLNSIGNKSQIDAIRAARNAKLEDISVMLMTSIYYQDAAEISTLLDEKPLLKARLKELVNDNIDVVVSLVQGRPANLSAEALNEITYYLEELKLNGSIKLQYDINFVLLSVRSGQLLRGLGITIE
jgi:PKD repeat protein